ncbi:MAG: Flp pilus assembly protein TadB [Marivirga sp.]|jgi:Flp pilus assembly protein TadB
MEFEEITKIWDQQNSKTLFVINEEAMHNRIRSKLKAATKENNINDFCLIAISLITAAYVLFSKANSLWNVVTAVALLLITVFIIVNRVRRKQRNKDFDQSMLGGLNHAIENIKFEIKRAKTFTLWFLLPVAVPTVMNMIEKEATVGRWLFVVGMCMLAIFVTQLGLQKKMKPKRKNLEALRDKLTEPTNDV